MQEKTIISFIKITMTSYQRSKPCSKACPLKLCPKQASIAGGHHHKHEFSFTFRNDNQYFLVGCLLDILISTTASNVCLDQLFVDEPGSLL